MPSPSASNSPSKGPNFQDRPIVPQTPPAPSKDAGPNFSELSVSRHGETRSPRPEDIPALRESSSDVSPVARSIITGVAVAAGCLVCNAITRSPANAMSVLEIAAAAIGGFGAVLAFNTKRVTSWIEGIAASTVTNGKLKLMQAGLMITGIAGFAGGLFVGSRSLGGGIFFASFIGFLEVERIWRKCKALEMERIWRERKAETSKNQA